MRIQLELTIDFGSPIPLADVVSRRKEFPRCGVYFIVACATEKEAREAKPTDEAVVYIGKANREEMSSRCQKHLWSITDARLLSGNPRSSPGAAFKRYRESVGLSAADHWVIPGAMSDDKPYLIPCAEEYLLHEYVRTHGRLPLCNTAG